MSLKHKSMFNALQSYIGSSWLNENALVTSFFQF